MNTFLVIIALCAGGQAKPFNWINAFIGEDLGQFIETSNATNLTIPARIVEASYVTSTPVVPEVIPDFEDLDDKKESDLWQMWPSSVSSTSPPVSEKTSASSSIAMSTTHMTTLEDTSPKTSMSPPAASTRTGSGSRSVHALDTVLDTALNNEASTPSAAPASTPLVTSPMPTMPTPAESQGSESLSMSSVSTPVADKTLVSSTTHVATSMATSLTSTSLPAVSRESGSRSVYAPVTALDNETSTYSSTPTSTLQVTSQKSSMSTPAASQGSGSIPMFSGIQCLIILVTSLCLVSRF